MKKFYLGILVLIITFNVFANKKNKEPTRRVNINKQSDLFDKSMDDWQGKKKELRDAMSTDLDSLNNDSAKKELKIFTNKTPEEIQENQDNLSSINTESLSVLGKEKMKRDKLDNDYSVDYDKPLNKQYLRDAEEFVRGSKKIMDNLGKNLKKHFDVDCGPVKGDKIIKPEYLMQTNTKKIMDTKYNPAKCQDLQNKYNCEDILDLRCDDLQFVPGKIINLRGNTTMHQAEDGHIIVGQKAQRSLHSHMGEQLDFIFTFDIDNIHGIQTFKLEHLYWADHLLLKLNDIVVFQSEDVRNKLEITYGHYRTVGGRRYHGVDVGGRDYVCANTTLYPEAYPSKELKHYLKNGANTLHFRMVYGNGGRFATYVFYKEKKCNKWQDNWRETCTLNTYQEPVDEKRKIGERKKIEKSKEINHEE